MNEWILPLFVAFIFLIGIVDLSGRYDREICEEKAENLNLEFKYSRGVCYLKYQGYYAPVENIMIMEGVL